MKRRWLAILCALIGGWFGLHRFYLRQAELGLIYAIVYFVFSWRLLHIPLTLILGWYDAYRFLMMDDDEFDRKYNSYYFRDRYGRRRAKARERHTWGGRYILIEDDGYGGAIKNSENNVSSLKRKRESEAYKKLGIKYFQSYDLPAALQNFEKALELTPEDKTLHFNIACVYSMVENEYKAFFHLTKAAELGFDDYSKIESHEALAYIRVLPAFQVFKNNRFRLSAEDLAKVEEEMQSRKAQAVEPMEKIVHRAEQIRLTDR